MGVMKRKLLLILAIFTAVCMQTNAQITVEETTAPDYLINNGYSEATAEEVMLVKNRIAGKPVEPLYEYEMSGFKKFLKNCYSYIDPSIDDSEERYHHNIRLSPSFKDY